MSYLNPGKLIETKRPWLNRGQWAGSLFAMCLYMCNKVVLKGKARKKAQAVLPGKVSEWGHGPHAPNSYLPACASGNADSPPPLASQSHWPHQARPGWGLSRSAARGPEGPLQSLPPCQSRGPAQGHAWSSGWAAVSFGVGRDSVMMVPKMMFPKSFRQHEG